MDKENKIRELAKKMNKLLMVDHTFLYTCAVQKMKELIEFYLFHL